MMYRILFTFLFLATCHLPLATSYADSLEAQKAEAIKQMTQETMPLGGGRFLLIDGGPGVYENVYGFDIIKVVDGVPKREPLFMQEFDAETHGMDLSDAVAISAMSYSFDKKDNTLTYTSRSADGSQRYRYKYTLAGDMFVLDEVMGQDYCADASCKSKSPQILFKADTAPATAPTAAPKPVAAAEPKPAPAAPAPAAAAPAAGKPEEKKPAEVKPEPAKATIPADAQTH